jgi:DNA-binding response OmpR family regulator
VVVLDLKLLGLDGYSVLNWIRAHEQWAKLPVIIHSGSDRPDDVIWCHLLGATNYIVKDALCTRLPHYLKVWFSTSARPDEDQASVCTF